MRKAIFLELSTLRYVWTDTIIYSTKYVLNNFAIRPVDPPPPTSALNQKTPIHKSNFQPESVHSENLLICSKNRGRRMHNSASSDGRESRSNLGGIVDQMKARVVTIVRINWTGAGEDKGISDRHSPRPPPAAAKHTI